MLQYSHNYLLYDDDDDGDDDDVHPSSLTFPV